MSYQEFLIDKRVVDRYMQKGMVTKPEYQKYLEKLPDMASNVDYTKVEEEVAEESDET